MERVHIRRSRQQAGGGARAEPSSAVQSESVITADSGQSDRWSGLSEPIPPGHYLLQKHTR